MKGDLLELHIKRMRRILDIAKANDEEVVILGAFGCFVDDLFYVYLQSEEKSDNTIKKYLRDVRTFAQYCGDMEVTKSLVGASI